MYTSQYYTNPEIDERLLQGYYDDAVAAGFTGSKADFHQAIIKARNLSNGVSDIDSLHSITDFGTYLYTGNGWKGLVNVNFDASSKVSQVALSSSTPSYENDSLIWLSGKPCVMVRTYTNGAWSAWSKAGADVVNDLVTGGTDKALSAEQGKVLKENLDDLGLEIGHPAPVEHPYSEALQDYSWYKTGNVAVGSVYTGATEILSGGEWRRWERISVSAGQKATISTKGGQNARAFCITDAETNIVIAKAGASESYIDEPFVYSAEVDSYLYVNTSKNYEGYILIESSHTTRIVDRVITLEGSFGNLANNVSEIQESVEPIVQDFASSSEEMTPINDITSYAIGTDGSVTAISLSGFHIKFYEVEQGDTIHIQITRANANAGKRLSGCFYHTDDDQTYNVVSIDGFVLWSTNGNLSVDYEVTVPSGVNRIGVYGGQNTPNIVSFSVKKVVSGDMAILKENLQDILNSTKEVSQHMPSELDERITTLENEESFSYTPIISNPFVDLKKATLKVLDIGNSFTADATAYLSAFVLAANIDVSDMCLYTMLRSSGSWYTIIKSWNGQDGSSGTTSAYSFQKVFGGITPTYDDSDSLTRMHSVLKDVDWDLIILHQVSDYSADYRQWEGQSSAGYLKEVIRILRTYQPQASIGMLMAHASRLKASGDTNTWWQGIVGTVRFMQARYGVDFIIPVATSIENIRASSLNTSTHGLSRDNHHLGYGIARYVAAATYYQMLVCGRYGGSVVGNTCVHAVTTSERSDAGEAYQGDLIDVTAENRQVAQIAAALACSDMFTIVNPDGVTI